MSFVEPDVISIYHVKTSPIIVIARVEHACPLCCHDSLIMFTALKNMILILYRKNSNNEQNMSAREIFVLFSFFESRSDVY